MMTKLKRNSIVILVLLFISAFIKGYLYVPEVYEEEEIEEEEEVLSNVPFAQYFQQYAPQIGWEWELLAAVAYHESRYNPHAGSEKGAAGLMQLVPRTAARFGLNDSTVFEPEDNIRAGVQYISFLQRHFRAVTDTMEQAYFVLASYNAGPAHIHDARRLAREYGDNPNKWYGHTEVWLERLSDEAYYTDSLVQYGEFRSGTTRRYVNAVMHTYQKIREEEAALRARTASSAADTLSL